MEPEEILSDLNVSVYCESGIQYPTEPPYSPNVKYSEYISEKLSKSNNKVYSALRKTFLLLNLDKENYNKHNWNPLKDMVEPGYTVVIKPNFVINNHNNKGNLFSIITHPSIIRAIIDYVYIALKGSGRIIIADSPQMDCNFEDLLEKTELESIKQFYYDEFNFKIEIIDLRELWVNKSFNDEIAWAENRKSLVGDPEGYINVNLGKKSLFYNSDYPEKFYGADYNRNETIKHHSDGKQEYLISKTILSADTIISVPKLKVHKKVGVTLNIKGLVGTVVNKNCLVHYKLGSPSSGGDEYPDRNFNHVAEIRIKISRYASDILLSKQSAIFDKFYKVLLKIFSPIISALVPYNKNDSVSNGNWYGNDSAWRMAIDLLYILYYANENGQIMKHPSKKMFSVIDGILGGEGDGPLLPDCRKSGVLIAGSNLGAIDLVASRLIGFDVNKIKMLKHVLDHSELFKVDLSSIIIHSNLELSQLFNKENNDPYLDFKPPSGWKNLVN